MENEKVWIISVYNTFEAGFKTAAYNNMFFKSKKDAENYLKTLKHKFLFKIQELNLFNKEVSKEVSKNEKRKNSDKY